MQKSLMDALGGAAQAEEIMNFSRGLTMQWKKLSASGILRQREVSEDQMLNRRWQRPIGRTRC